MNSLTSYLKSWLKSYLASLPRGLGTALTLLKDELVFRHLHRRGVKKAKAFQGKTKLKLNIGCGGNRKKDWVNIDLFRIPDLTTSDLTLDIREPIPLSSGSCQFIYSEHFFEHLGYPDEAKHFLAESFRLLEPGGIFSVGVPDAEWTLLAYAGLDRGGYFETYAKQWDPAWCATRMEHINYLFRQGTEHRFAYDFETLQHALAAIGFVNIRRREFNSDLDAKWRKLGTLYVDAVKPPHGAVRT
jgi:predicted SAM-dependent methyltransferase